MTERTLMEKRLAREQIVVLLAAMLISIWTGLFLWNRISGPSDGARLAPSRQTWQPEGVAVAPIGEGTSSLRSGDVVIAVDGQPVVEQAKMIFQPNVTGVKWEPGQSVLYTIIRDENVQDVPVTMRAYPYWDILRSHWGVMLFALVSQAIVTYVFYRRPGDRVAQVLFLWGWSASHTYAWSFGMQISDLWNPAVYWMYSVMTPGVWLFFWGVTLHFALIFPQRRPFLRKYPKVSWAVYVSGYLIFIAYLLFLLPNSESLLVWLGGWSRGGYLVAALYLFLVIALIAHGYRTSRDPVIRTQVRWVVYAAFLSGGGGLILWILPPLIFDRVLLSVNAFGLMMLPFPVSFGIAILRYRLFDIDVIIRKTLVYSAMTAILAAIYFTSVVLLQIIFRAFIADISQVAIVVSTLTIAALFNPLRRRVQEAIDLRFYRQRYDAERTLADFGSKLRDEVDLHQLRKHLLEAVDETIKPASASLWLRDTGKD